MIQYFYGINSICACVHAWKRVYICYCLVFSHVWLFVMLWSVAHQAPLSMGFCRQEYWSGLPCSPPGDLPDPGVEPMSLTCAVLASGFFTSSTAWKPNGTGKTQTIPIYGAQTGAESAELLRRLRLWTCCEGRAIRLTGCGSKRRIRDGSNVLDLSPWDDGMLSTEMRKALHRVCLERVGWEWSIV